MFTVAEAELCLSIIGEKLKQQRAKTPAGEGATNSEQDSELMLLVSINNKLTAFGEKQTTSAAKLASPKVLIVDDVDDMLDIVGDLLYEMGFEKIDAVSSAEKAMTSLLAAVEAGTPYKLVLTDSDMSGKSGLELLKEIRLNEALSATDVFILSTDSAQEAIVNAMQAGVTGYILKPLNFKILQQKLAAYLPDSEQSDKVEATDDKADETVSDDAGDKQPAAQAQNPEATQASQTAQATVPKPATTEAKANPETNPAAAPAPAKAE